MKLLWGALALATASLVGVSANAEYPERPVTIINPNSAGGGTGVGILTWKPHMDKCLGEEVVMVSVPGGTGAVGFAQLATADMDGYTVGSLNMPQFVTNTIVRDAPWKPETFKIFGALIGQTPMAVVKRDGPFKKLEDFTKHALASDKPVNVGVGGLGAAAHLTALRYMRLSGAKFNFIPFGDGNSARNGILSGNVDITFISDNETKPFENELVPLAASAPKRSGNYPDVPTFGELGYDIAFPNTHLIGAPADLPDEAAAKWTSCVEKLSTDPEFLADAKKRKMSVAIVSAEEGKEMIANQIKIFKDMWNEEPWLKK